MLEIFITIKYSNVNILKKCNMTVANIKIPADPNLKRGIIRCLLTTADIKTADG